MQTTNYVLNSEFVLHSDGLGSERVLPAGAYIRPIHRKYVPKHVLDKYKGQDIVSCYEYCYTRYGIILIPKSFLRQE